MSEPVYRGTPEGLTDGLTAAWRDRDELTQLAGRSITPIEKKLRIEAYFDYEEGRKRILRGVIRDGATVCADAEGLFVALRPGQP
jgi:hypothetical protein